MTPAPHQVTELLKEWSDGDETALEQLMPLVYEELRSLARNYLAESAAHAAREVRAHSTNVRAD